MKNLSYTLTVLLLNSFSFNSFAAPPVIIINGSSDTTINVFSQYLDEGATAIDAEDGNITNSIVITNYTDTSAIGDYIILYTVADADSNTVFAIRNVRVRDLEKPTLTYLGEDSSCVQHNGTYTSPGALATDNYDSTINSSIHFATNINLAVTGYYWEKFWVTDSSGNTSDTLHITIVLGADCFPPVLTIIGASDTTIDVNSVWTDPGSTAVDAVEGVVTYAIVTTGYVDTKKVGVNFIRYDVQDAMGHATYAIRTVRVVDRLAPLIDNERADKADSCWVVNVQLQSIFVDVTTASDNYNSLTNGLTLIANPADPTGGAEVDTRFQGTTTVTYTATDSSGNSTTQCIKYVVRDYIGKGPFGFYGEEDTVIVQVNTPFRSTIKFRDSFDGDLSDSIRMSLNVDIQTIGTYWANYSVTNSRGQKFEKTTIVKVLDLWRPIINGKNGSVAKILVNSIYDPIDYIVLSDNYDPPSILRDSLIIISNDLDITTPGLYSTTFQTKDRSNNLSNIYTFFTDIRLTLSTPNLRESQFAKVFPNPVSDILFIDSKEALSPTDIALFDAMGKEIHFSLNQAYAGYGIDVQGLSAGLYSLEIRSGDKIQREKVLID